MHELSLAQNIVEIIHQHVHENDLHNVTNVKTVVGECSGVAAESLAFSFSVIVNNTPLNNANLVIQKIPFEVYCNVCKKKSSNEFGMNVCSFCASTNCEILSGTEMNIVEIEMFEQTKKNV
ncbi:MAG: hydrogenase maturation nickel metallochaperone HypA [Ignavibacteria bacterium]|nr:hydrogenase maturation nickel metallochaperone HypA [Ignavibacteria bacterium]